VLYPVALLSPNCQRTTARLPGRVALGDSPFSLIVCGSLGEPTDQEIPQDPLISCSGQIQPLPFLQFVRMNGGGKRARTADPLLAKQVLYQLSYTPSSDMLQRHEYK
jgi:hypothetical protein